MGINVFGCSSTVANQRLRKKVPSGEHLELLAAATAEGEEGFGILEVVVIALACAGLHLGRDDFVRLDRRAVGDGDDADLVGFVVSVLGGGKATVSDDDRPESVGSVQLQLPRAYLSSSWS